LYEQDLVAKGQQLGLNPQANPIRTFVNPRAVSKLEIELVSGKLYPLVSRISNPKLMSL